MAKKRNEAVISGNHQYLVGMNSTPRSDHGTTPTIMATKAPKKSTSTSFWRPVMATCSPESSASVSKLTFICSRSAPSIDVSGAALTLLA